MSWVGDIVFGAVLCCIFICATAIVLKLINKR